MAYKAEMKLLSKHGYEISCLDGTIPGQKAVVLCLHGFSGSKRSPRIERLHEEMVPEGIGTFTFDWPAHGESKAKFRDLKIENCLDDLHTVYEYVREKYPVPIWCFATSFGGYLAVLYHLRYPEAFDKLMLRSPALRMDQILTSFMNDDQHRQFMEGGTLDFGLEQPLLLARDFYEDISAHDAFSPEPEHTERIVIIQGDRDDVVPPEHTRMYADRNHITLYWRQGANHSYDNPGDVDWVMERAKEFFVL